LEILHSVNYAYRFYVSLILHVRNVRIICSRNYRELILGVLWSM